MTQQEQKRPLQVSQLTLNGTCASVTRLCQYCTRPQGFMSKTGHATESFPDRIIFASMFNDNTNWERQKVQDQCPVQAREVASCDAWFRPGFWCSCGSGSEKTWTCKEYRSSHQFADGECDKLALRMIREPITSQHTCTDEEERRRELERISETSEKIIPCSWI